MEKPKRYRAKAYSEDFYVEGYYFEYPERQEYAMSPHSWDNIPVVSCIASYHPGDWGMENRPYFCRIDVDTLEEIGV